MTARLSSLSAAVPGRRDTPVQQQHERGGLSRTPSEVKQAAVLLPREILQRLPQLLAHFAAPLISAQVVSHCPRSMVEQPQFLSHSDGLSQSSKAPCKLSMTVVSETFGTSSNRGAGVCCEAKPDGEAAAQGQGQCGKAFCHAVNCLGAAGHIPVDRLQQAGRPPHRHAEVVPVQRDEVAKEFLQSHVDIALGVGFQLLSSMLDYCLYSGECTRIPSAMPPFAHVSGGTQQAKLPADHLH